MAVNSTSENNIGAIIDQAFAIAAQAEKLAATKAATPCRIPTATYVFDPLNDDERVHINALAHITIDRPVPLGGRKTIPSDTVPCPMPAKDAQSGSGEAPCIYFRALRMYRMDVHLSEIASVQFLFSAPDQDATYAIPMNRKAFVKFDVRLTFDHGVLTKFESNDPSQALAVLQIPANLIKDILGLETSSAKK